MSRILVIDDDPDFCLALARYLRAGGDVVDCQPDGHQGLRDVLSKHPDVILLDLHMPVMDGLAFLGIVRSYFRLRFIPIVVMTGNDDPKVLAEVERYGVTQILKKGHFDFSDLRQAILLSGGPGPGPGSGLDGDSLHPSH